MKAVYGVLIIIEILALGLNVRAVIAAHVGAFVPVHAAALQGVVNDLGRALHKALLIGILNAEDELAAVLFGKEVIIQGGSEAAEMHEARGAGGKPGTYFHGDEASIVVVNCRGRVSFR